jgi:hypothetical protein
MRHERTAALPSARVHCGRELRLLLGNLASGLQRAGDTHIGRRYLDELRGVDAAVDNDRTVRRQRNVARHNTRDEGVVEIIRSIVAFVGVTTVRPPTLMLPEAPTTKP